MAEESKLETITKCASAALAAKTTDQDVRVKAIKYFYNKLGVYADDPVIGFNGSMYKNKEQFESVVKTFGEGKYNEVLAKSTISEILGYARGWGYNAPESIKRSLGPYMNKTYLEIMAGVLAGKQADEKIEAEGGEDAFANRANELAPLLKARAKGKEYKLVMDAIMNIDEVKLKGRLQLKVIETAANHYLNNLAKAIREAH